MKMPLRKDLIYPELSYIIIGILFDVYNKLGPGHKEKYYQEALALGLKSIGLSCEEQVYIPLLYKDKKIGNYYLDFLVEKKIILEIKSNSQFLKRDIFQVFSYLKAQKLKLGILANFAKDTLYFRRILNLH